MLPKILATEKLSEHPLVAMLILEETIMSTSMLKRILYDFRSLLMKRYVFGCKGTLSTISGGNSMCT